MEKNGLCQNFVINHLKITSSEPVFKLCTFKYLHIGGVACQGLRCCALRIWQSDRAWAALISNLCHTDSGDKLQLFPCSLPSWQWKKKKRADCLKNSPLSCFNLRTGAGKMAPTAFPFLPSQLFTAKRLHENGICHHQLLFFPSWPPDYQQPGQSKDADGFPSSWYDWGDPSIFLPWALWCTAWCFSYVPNC